MPLSRFVKNPLLGKKNHDHFGHFFDLLFFYSYDYHESYEHSFDTFFDLFSDLRSRHNLVDETDNEYDPGEDGLADDQVVVLDDLVGEVVGDEVQATNFFKFVAIFVYFSMVHYFLPL